MTAANPEPTFEDRPSPQLIESERPESVAQPIVFSVLLGGIAGIAAYWAYSIYLVSNMQPPSPQSVSLSYGQAWAYGMTPLAAILGALACLNMLLTFTGRGLWGTVICASGSLIVGFLVRYLWDESLKSFGPDPSDAILYVPLMRGSQAVFYIAGLSMIITLYLAFQRANSKTQPADASS